MINSTPRQKYLYLVARLYELAAEFTDADLRIISESFVRKDEPGITKAIEAFMLLHGVAQGAARSTVTDELDSKRRKKNSSQVWARKVTQNVLSGQALSDLFGDESLFPRVQDIARVIPGDLPPQPKEGRSRYVRRAVKHVASLDEPLKATFRNNLAAELEKKPDNFLSQWKNLIREL